MQEKLFDLFSKSEDNDYFTLCFPNAVADAAIQPDREEWTINVMMRFENNKLIINFTDYEDKYFVIPKYISLRDLSNEIIELSSYIQEPKQSTIDNIQNFIVKIAPFIAIYQLA